MASPPEWSEPRPGPYPNTMEIERPGPWCNECQMDHVDRISRRREGDKLIYWRSYGPHWMGFFNSAEEAKEREVPSR